MSDVLASILAIRVVGGPHEAGPPCDSSERFAKISGRTRRRCGLELSKGEIVCRVRVAPSYEREGMRPVLVVDLHSPDYGRLKYLPQEAQP